MTTTTDTHVPDTPAELVEAEAPAQHVIEALRRVIRDLPAIGKEGVGPSAQGSYAFRGIEQIVRHTSILFARHGVVMTPHKIDWRETRINDKSTDTELVVTYRVYGPGGLEDFIDVETPGIGRDSTDKGSNKAMTAAYKYALTQTLQIADAKDDGDRYAITTDSGYPDQEDEPAVATKAQITRIRDLTRELRDRGDDPSTTDDVGAVLVLGQEVIGPVDGKLVPSITTDAAAQLIRRLGEKLADHVIAANEADSAPAAESPPAATAPAEAAPPADINAEPWEGTQAPEMTDREAAAREALERVQPGAGAVKEPPRSRSAARAPRS